MTTPAMAEQLVPDEVWDAIQPLLPPKRPHPKGGPPWIEDRAVLGGIIYVLRAGVPWRLLPARELGVRGRMLMALEWEQVIVDATDPVALGRWWADALDWVVVNDDPEEFEIRPAPDRLPGLLFVRVPEPKTLKNRLHLDFRPDDRDAEVARFLDLGATRADIGQGEQTWVVLSDPEGNEFCVLAGRRP